MIKLLNSDPETAPAVIGVDICIFGELKDDPSGATVELVEEMQKAGNVILVEQAVTGISVDETENGQYTVGREISYFDQPCNAVCRYDSFGYHAFFCVAGNHAFFPE